MADAKLPDLTELAETPHADDLFYVVDVSDTTDGATGTNKKVKRSNVVGGLATTTNLSDHAADTTAIHGIADTAALETAAGAQSKVDSHSADTTSVHGIADTAALALDAAVVHDTGDETVAGVKTFSSDPLIPDEAYDATAWNGSLEPATKNAIRDKFESLSSGGQTLVTHIVASSGGTHTTLNAALTAASNGDTIYIREGTIDESGAAITSALTDITIIGENPESSIISMGTRLLTLSGARVRLMNLRMTGSTIMLTMSGADAAVRGCVFVTSTTTGGCITMSGVQGRFIDNRVESSGTTPRALLNITGENVIVGNNTFDILSGNTNSGFGNIIIDGHRCALVGNTIDVETGNAGPVVYSANGSNPLVVGNNVDGGTTSHFFKAVGVANPTITGNVVINCQRGVDLASALGGTVSGNSLTVDATSGTCHGVITAQAGVVITGNNIRMSTSGTSTGITISTGAESVVISGNHIESADTGINVANSGIDETVISGNTFEFCTTNLTDSGTGTNTTGNTGLPPTLEKHHVRVKNTSGATINAGNLVVWKAVAAGDEVTTTTTAGDDKVYGVASAAITNNSYGLVQVAGKTTLLTVNGTTDIAIGDQLTSFTAAGIAAKAAAGDMVIAYALEAYTTDDSLGVIDALIVSPRLI